MTATDVQKRRPIDPIELARGVSMRFEVIPPVDVQERAHKEKKPLFFLMGTRGKGSDEEPRHRVIIPAPFYFGAFPVTQRQFGVWTASEDYAAWFAEHRDEVDEKTPHQNSFSGRPDLPAENLSWYEASAFLSWLNRSGKVAGGLEARLPCEAEWEYACRAGMEMEYWSGDGESALREVGWFSGNAENRTHVVGEKNAPNPWGLHDLHGNVWEWCKDAWDTEAYSSRPDGWVAKAWKSREDSPRRVMRGGSWDFTAGGCRSACRVGGHPRYRYRFLGFRVLLSLPGPAEPCSQRGGGGAERAGGRDDRPGERSAGAGPLDRDLDTLHKPGHDPA